MTCSGCIKRRLPRPGSVHRRPGPEATLDNRTNANLAEALRAAKRLESLIAQERKKV